MKILVISGSPRDNANSLNVANYCCGILNQHEQVEANVLDMNNSGLEPWSFSATPNQNTQELIDTADGYIFVVPEWHGMVPPRFKEIFFYFNALFAHKPAYIIGVSSGSGGRYPITELRSSTYKNSFLNYIPISTVLDHVEEVINNEAEYIAESDFIAQRIDEGIQFLISYSQALGEVRKTDIFKEKRFKNGL